MDPLTAGITYSAMGGGADAGAAGGAALFSNPITAAIAAAALGTAYGVSPSVRKYTNRAVKAGWEGLTNPIQHFGDGSDKDTIGAMYNRIDTNFNPANFNGKSGLMDLSMFSGKNGQMDLGNVMDQPKSLLNISKTMSEGQQNQRRGNNQQQQNGYGADMPNPFASMPPIQQPTYYPFPAQPKYYYPYMGGTV